MTRMSDLVILIVDDDRDSRVILRMALGTRGFSTLEANDGREGVAMARDHEPDAVVMDLSMPEMNGCEAARAIRDDAALAATPIVAVTGTELSRPEEERIDRLFDALHLKPLAMGPFLDEMSGLFPPTLVD